jgi:hypothetical protein
MLPLPRGRGTGNPDVLISLQPLCLLYAAFMVKHFLCDYPLQSAWMAKTKGAASGWAGPLAAHAATHAAGTLVIALATVPALAWLALVDLLVHAAVDRSKSMATRGLSPGQSQFWWALGLDQGAHQATHFCYVIALVTRL